MSDRELEKGTRISRRQFIGRTAVAGGGVIVVAALAGSASAAPAKFPQAKVHYQPVPKSGQRCQNCSLWQAPNACSSVEGPISPAGWCMLYQPKG
jgi:hypothetical protein